MIPEARLRDLAHKLLVKSLAGGVVWTASGGAAKTVSLDFAGIPVKQRVYTVSLPRARVFVGFHSPSVGPDYVLVQFARSDTDVVAEWKVEDGEPDWELAQSLYSEAHRQVTHWDEVLHAVEEAVSADGVIGEPQAAAR